MNINAVSPTQHTAIQNQVNLLDDKLIAAAKKIDIGEITKLIELGANPNTIFSTAGAEFRAKINSIMAFNHVDFSISEIKSTFINDMSPHEEALVAQEICQILKTMSFEEGGGKVEALFLLLEPLDEYYYRQAETFTTKEMSLIELSLTARNFELTKLLFEKGVQLSSNYDLSEFPHKNITQNDIEVFKLILTYNIDIARLFPANLENNLTLKEMKEIIQEHFELF